MIERAARLLAPAGVALFVAAGVAFGDRPWPFLAAGTVLAVLAAVVAATLPLHGSAASAAMVVVALGAALVCAEASNVGFFATAIAVGWSAYAGTLAGTVVLTVLLELVFVVGYAGETDEAGWFAWITATAFTAAATLMARRQRDLLTQLRRAQSALAEQAAAEERNRIAHELHDVIGHALTVSLLHVTSARLALDEDPAEAAASLAEAERLAQQSLAEVRAVVGLMKDADASAPLPGAGELDALVASFRRAGAEVEWSVDGDPAALTATEGLTVYRIVQEALTNAVRHAPGSPALARLEVAPGRTRLVVDTAAPAREPVGSGTGLAGMRERAEALGGRLTAGPPADGVAGWRVEAVLP